MKCFSRHNALHKATEKNHKESETQYPGLNTEPPKQNKKQNPTDF
jgi:hypothetical protein